MTEIKTGRLLNEFFNYLNYLQIKATISEIILLLDYFLQTKFDSDIESHLLYLEHFIELNNLIYHQFPSTYKDEYKDKLFKLSNQDIIQLNSIEHFKSYINARKKVFNKFFPKTMEQFKILNSNMNKMN